MADAVKVSNDSPVLLDRFLDHAIEVDVDAICDGKDVVIGGIMEHIEQAGRALRRLGLLAAAVQPEPRSQDDPRPDAQAGARARASSA